MQICLEIFQQPRAADVNVLAFVPGTHAAPLECLELLDDRQFRCPFLGRFYDCPGDNVLRVPFNGRSERQSLGFRRSLYSRDADHALVALGQRACLVEDDGIQLPGRFQGQTVADQDAIFGGDRGGDRHDQGHRQA